ncbi:Uncharacterized protein dnl_12930 [Desulfonema limicola]|uniref:Uncharacterized protein n=1 Tax=Desulfonema limicola TaxID=45656 RepID=A0A975B5D3_9BACT|nr:hypothetical protein [Desulfonema limicola]QTA79044.1 Uncharacterized protein dnl_12930 [Desulfonema limicola]
MEISDSTRRFLEKWKEFTKPGRSRYPVLIVIPNNRNMYNISVMDEICSITDFELFDFQKVYQKRLHLFIPRNSIRTEIVTNAAKQPVIFINIEFFYNKWTEEERIAFLKDIIRQDGHKGIVLIMYCEEEFLSVIEIPENSRGVIWNP